MKSNSALAVGFFVFYFACILGWIVNAARTTSCDYVAPYKCEVVRGLGVVVPPVGAIAGYLDLGE